MTNVGYIAKGAALSQVSYGRLASVMTWKQTWDAAALSMSA